MHSSETTPVLVGVGQALQRLDDPSQALEPLALMQAALEEAAQDSGAPSLLKQATAFYVLRGAWGYADPGRELARREEADRADEAARGEAHDSQALQRVRVRGAAPPPARAKVRQGGRRRRARRQ